MPIFRTARYQVRPESVDKYRAANEQFIEYIRASEPETLRYTALQQTDDPTRFMNFMIFQDSAAEDQHRNSDGVKRFTGILYPETIARVGHTSYAVVAST